ncbi:flagellar assembly protein FliH [Bacillus sp. 2205SS5-2]|uniref:flagellar assembly protein FliH n=1 Tax=Bacillus sp. 2205SS5-2 TaxID=3109031 RepID=UPI003007E04B
MSRIFKSRQTSPTPETTREIGLKVLPSFFSQEEDKAQPELENRHVDVLKEANQEAHRIVEEANMQRISLSEEIEIEKQEFQQFKQATLEEARTKGYEAGFQQGYVESVQKHTELIQEAQSIIESSKEEYLRQIQVAEKLILTLGMKSAEKILGKTLKEEPEAFLSIVKRGIKEAIEMKEIQIHVHPTNHALLMGYSEEIRKLIPPNTLYYLYPNEDLTETECYIDSNQGRIIVSVDSQLQQLQAKLVELLEGGS